MRSAGLRGSWYPRAHCPSPRFLGFVRSLTFKQGTKGAREEREIRLSVDQFDALWPATVGRRLTKARYDVPWKGRTIEIDIYRGRLAGLVVAEVEFDDQRSCAAFEPPDWIGRDVTGKPKYSNVALALKRGARKS